MSWFLAVVPSLARASRTSSVLLTFRFFLFLRFLRVGASADADSSAGFRAAWAASLDGSAFARGIDGHSGGVNEKHSHTGRLLRRAGPVAGTAARLARRFAGRLVGCGEERGGGGVDAEVLADVIEDLCHLGPVAQRLDGPADG